VASISSGPAAARLDRRAPKPHQAGDKATDEPGGDLTLRAVGGLTTAEIARAFLIPEATMAQRTSRAKQRIKASGEPFSRPAAGEFAERLRSVLHVLYLIFTEGHAPTSGAMSLARSCPLRRSA
jgi:predicted RNA polymerase sigma factor